MTVSVSSARPEFLRFFNGIESSPDDLDRIVGGVSVVRVFSSSEWTGRAPVRECLVGDWSSWYDCYVVSLFRYFKYRFIRIPTSTAATFHDIFLDANTFVVITSATTDDNTATDTTVLVVRIVVAIVIVVYGWGNIAKYTRWGYMSVLTTNWIDGCHSFRNI